MPRHAMPVKKKKVSAKVFLLIILVLVGVMGFAVYRFVSESVQLSEEQKQFDDLRDLIVEEDNGNDDPTAGSDSPTDPTTGAVTETTKRRNYDKLFAMNEDMRGWLSIEGTVIDYPVMKNDSDNGEYYLHRDFYGDYSFAGCLFIGVNCDYDSNVFIIYGHNMNNGSMFGTLLDYADSSYAAAHRDINFDTKTEHRVYRVFAAFEGEIYPDDPKNDGYFKYYQSVGNFDEDMYNYILNQYYSSSCIYTEDKPKYPDQIMILSTCYYDNVRFVVAAYRIK